jgi:ribose transport system substrate-binding protein
MAEEFPNIELVTMTSSTISIEEGLSVTADMLTANPHVDGIFTIDDSLAIGVLQAVREAGRTDVQYISGCGGAQIFFHSIADTDDIFLFSATYSADMIVDTMALAAEWLNGRRDFSDLFDLDFGQDNVVIIQPEIITRYNVENFFAPGSPW